MHARLHFLFLNVGHFLDHLLMLVFATVAALVLAGEWGMSYAELVPYATPGFIAFGLFSLPAGWLADRWSREGMIVVYFLGAGAAAIATGFARTPVELALGLFLIGVFAAIYHPVGLALVYDSAKRAGMALAANGVWGNMGVASAALLTGFFIDHAGWRAAFFWPGAASIALGLGYAWLVWGRPAEQRVAPAAASTVPAAPSARDREMRDLLLRVSVIIFFTTAVAGIVFQSTTFALPKVFEERLGGIAVSATLLGWLTFVVFAVASVAQLIVGHLLDRFGARPVFMGIALLQAVFFAIMPGLSDWSAMAVALGFMLGTFGQIPINDYMIGRVADPTKRASIYGVRFIVSFTALALALPLVAWVHRNWGFDVLFQILAVSATCIFLAAALLPRALPQPAAVRAAAG